MFDVFDAFDVFDMFDMFDVFDFKDFIIAVGYGNISDKTMDLCVQKLSSA